MNPFRITKHADIICLIKYTDRIDLYNESNELIKSAHKTTASLNIIQ